RVVAAWIEEPERKRRRGRDVVQWRLGRGRRGPKRMGASTGGAPMRAGFELDRHRRSVEHTSELQSRFELVCRLLLEKKKIALSGPTSFDAPHLAGLSHRHDRPSCIRSGRRLLRYLTW